uniref:Uncharacterized protein n=1 Tax=Oryza brachyantha TaxID=4533 RepID=J3L8K8_ORYBR
MFGDMSRSHLISWPRFRVSKGQLIFMVEWMGDSMNPNDEAVKEMHLVFNEHIM